MEVGFNNQKVETSIAERNQTFGVKDPAIIFEILCNRMYQHPLQTSVQEYISNARDSHREAGCADKPIKIVLPTEVEPTLIIEDFGMGLSRQRIEEVFIYLGESTKRDSNLQTGGFGIGAKSGWAYSKSFGITTVHNGDKRVYIAFLGDSGIGSLDLISEEITDQSNGTAISLPIEIVDIVACRNAVHRTIALWPKQPIIKPESQKEKMQEITVNKQGNGWKYLTNFPIYNNSIILSVDGIPYPCPDGISNKGKLYLHNSSCLLLEFKTGELDMAVNREAIQVNDATIAHIEQRIDDICGEAVMVASKHLRGIRNPERMKRRAGMLQDQWGFVSAARDIWRNTEIVSKSIEETKTRTYDFKGLPVQILRYTRDSYRNRLSIDSWHDDDGFQFKNSDFVIVDDKFLKKLSPAKLKPWHEDKCRIRKNYIRGQADEDGDIPYNSPLYKMRNEMRYFYVIRPMLEHGLRDVRSYYRYAYQNPDNSDTAKTYTKDDFKEVFEDLKSFGFTMYTDLKAPKVNREKANGRIQAMTWGHFGAPTNDFHEMEDLVDNPQYYCFADIHEIKANLYWFQNTLKTLSNLFGDDIIPKVVLGMHTRNKKKIMASGIPHIKQVFAMYINRIKGQIGYDEWFGSNGYRWDLGINPEQIRDLGLTILDPEWQELEKIYDLKQENKTKGESPGIAALKAIQYIPGLKVPRVHDRLLDKATILRSQQAKYSRKLTRRFEHKYPLLETMGNYLQESDNVIKELVIYINASYLNQKENNQDDNS